jgi:hypothetical protein
MEAGMIRKNVPDACYFSGVAGELGGQAAPFIAARSDLRSSYSEIPRQRLSLQDELLRSEGLEICPMEFFGYKLG